MVIKLAELDTRWVRSRLLREFDQHVTLGGVGLPPFRVEPRSNHMVNSVKVGNTVLVPAKVLAVHPQGFPSGLDAHGRAVNPNEPPNPDTLELEVSGGVGGPARVFVSAAALSVPAAPVPR